MLMSASSSLMLLSALLSLQLLSASTLRDIVGIVIVIGGVIDFVIAVGVVDIGVINCVESGGEATMVAAV